MRIQFSKTKRILVLYLLFTLIYYFFGRQKWLIPSQSKLLLFVLLNILMFFFGYTLNTIIKRKGQKGNEIIDNQIEYTKNIRRVFLLSCGLLIIFQIATVITTIGSFRMFNVMQTIGESYRNRLIIIRSASASSESVLIMQIQTLFWGVTMFAYPIGFIYFKKMGKFDKLLLILTVLIDFFATLNLGITKNIGDLILIMVTCILLSVPVTIKKSKKKNNHPIMRIFLILILFLSIFSMIQSSREKTYNVQAGRNIYPEFSLLRENTVFDIVVFNNRTLSNIIDRIGIYVSHGYTGLAYAMELPYENTYGIGVSRALTDYANQYLDIDVSKQTFNARIQSYYGWPNGSLWPTAYTWIANSVSFWLVPLIIFLYGFFMASVEYRYIQERDIYSLALFCQLFIGAIYLPANAQLVQSKPSLWALALLLIIYYATNKKEKYNLYR